MDLDLFEKYIGMVSWSIGGIHGTLQWLMTRTNQNSERDRVLNDGIDVKFVEVKSYWNHGTLIL